MLRNILRETYIKLISNERAMMANRCYNACPGFIQNLIRGIAWTVRKVWGKKYIVISAPAYYYEKLDTITFYGMEFNIPCDAEKYLSMKYRDWKTPKDDWFIWRDDGCSDYYKERGDK